MGNNGSVIVGIQEKRQLFRLKDSIALSQRMLTEEEVNNAITQLTHEVESKSLFPELKEEHLPSDADISIFGLSFITKEMIPAGTNLALTMKLSSLPNLILAVSTVTHCERDIENHYCRVGVKFLYMHKEDFNTLEDYIVDKLQSALQQWQPGDNGMDSDFVDIDRI